MTASKAGGRQQIFRGKLLGLLVGKRPGAPPQVGCEHRLRRSQSLKPERNKTELPWRPRKQWKDSVDSISATNGAKPACVRTYFSVPANSSGFNLCDQDSFNESLCKSARNIRSRSVSPRVDTNLGGSRTQSVSPKTLKLEPSSSSTSFANSSTAIGRSNEIYLEREARIQGGKVNENRAAWDNHAFNSSEVNSQRSTYGKMYFSSHHDMPEKKKIQETLKSRGIAPRKTNFVGFFARTV